MPQFDELPPADQVTLSSFMPPFRETFVLVVQALNRLAQLDVAWLAAVKTIVESLDAGAVIPDTVSNGAAALTKEEMLALMAAAEDVHANHDGALTRALYIKVCGLQRTMG